MILDNQNNNLKVYEWLSKYINSGELSLVTGYFTIGALAYLSDLNKDLISKYRIILGDIYRRAGFPNPALFYYKDMLSCLNN